MARRWKMGRGESRNDFRRKAMKVHPKNASVAAPWIARGGIRL